MSLKDLRKDIDHLDNQILSIINQRMEIVKQIGAIKKKDQSPVYRPDREKEIIERLVDTNDGLLDRRAVEAIFLEIFAVGRNFELPERVSYLGPFGSFSHQAAELRFGAMNEYLPLSSIRSVFETVDTERSKYGVIPIENNQEGVVSETVYLLEEFEVQIVAEMPLDIHFAFGTREESLSKILKIYSRDIAFKQCRKFIREHFPDSSVELIPVGSTSKAVKIAMEEESSAAICSHVAAKEFNLPMLFDNIEDSSNNQTRFLIISKTSSSEPSEADKTSIMAKLPHRPGGLAAFLEEFHRAGINLTKIESYPAKHGKSFRYWFFIEFEGHNLDQNVSEILARHGEDLKWLGSYARLC